MERNIYSQYLGGLPEFLKKKYNYTTSFKIKELVIFIDNDFYYYDFDGTYKYIKEEKILNMRFNFDNFNLFE